MFHLISKYCTWFSKYFYMFLIVQWNLLKEYLVSTYSWIISTPHPVPVYTSCTQTNPDSKYLV